MAEQMRSLAESEYCWLPVLSNAAALLYTSMDRLNWAGFYLVDGDHLILGPFQGKPACTKILFGKGVCGSAWEQECILRIEDVHKFPGHITCDSASNSEIVLPIRDKGKIAAVLDIDSPITARFTKEDEEGLAGFVRVLEEVINWRGR